MNTMLATAFVLGVAGSAHCVGMCGPIALAVPVRGKGWRARLSSALLMNSGRLFMYVLIGIAFGAMGQGVAMAGLQRSLSIAAGLLLLLAAVIPGVLERWGGGSRLALVVGRLRGRLARNLSRTAPEGLLLTGMLNGLLPCGLVYAAAIGASAQADLWQGAVFMLVFGAATWPALIAVRMSGGLAGNRTRHYLRRFAPVAIGALAIMLLLRGAGLGIPFISPPDPAMTSQVAGCH
ncbi:MAG: sulfite exporter TauE/SafE family protein [Flavobacteriales bacterium]|nr:sulfite exporter TauE/SafE family protein [Flavobacteriales bacterium]